MVELNTRNKYIYFFVHYVLKYCGENGFGEIRAIDSLTRKSESAGTRLALDVSFLWQMRNRLHPRRTADWCSTTIVVWAV